jgi:hypothetical protein
MKDAMKKVMEKHPNQSLLIRLEMLSLEPVGSCFSVQGEEVQGSFYLFNHHILSACFGGLSGQEAVKALLERKDSWVFEKSAICPDTSDLNVYLQAILVDLLDFSKEANVQPSGSSSRKRQEFPERFEISVSVQGGPLDGQIFELFPGENPVSKLVDVVNESIDSANVSTNACIVLDESRATLMEGDSGYGILLNGEPVRSAVLSPEDVITFDQVTLKIHFELRQPVRIVVAREEVVVDPDAERSRQAVSGGKTINWKHFAPKTGKPQA